MFLHESKIRNSNEMKYQPYDDIAVICVVIELPLV